MADDRPTPDVTPLAASRDDILLMARLAGLDLPAAYQDELVEAYGYVRAMAALLPADRPRADEPAHVFDPTRFLPVTATRKA